MHNRCSEYVRQTRALQVLQLCTAVFRGEVSEAALSLSLTTSGQ